MNWHTTSHKGVVLPYNTLIHKGTPMRIVAHTKYGVFEGVENEYDEEKYDEIEKFLEKIHKLEYFCLMTDKGQIYFTSQIIADTLFILEK